MLAHHEPFPAVVMDRRWNVLRANAGATRLFGGLLAPAPLPEPANVLRLMIEPGPVRDAVSNWDAVAPSLLERARREAVGGVIDTDTRALLDRLRARADVAALLGNLQPAPESAPVIDVCFEFDGRAAQLLLSRLHDRHTNRRHRAGATVGKRRSSRPMRRLA